MEDYKFIIHTNKRVHYPRCIVNIQSHKLFTMLNKQRNYWFWNNRVMLMVVGWLDHCSAKSIWQALGHAMKHLFRYRISVNYYRLKWLKQYEHFRYAILFRNADDMPWTGIVVRLDWSGTNCCFFKFLMEFRLVMWKS